MLLWVVSTPPSRTSAQEAYEHLDAIGKLPPNVVAPDELTAEYLVTDEGAIQASALVTAWLVEQYGHGTDLSPEDMALIYAAYRQGVDKIVDPSSNATFQTWVEKKEGGLVGNGEFALPFVRYTATIYEH